MLSEKELLNLGLEERQTETLKIEERDLGLVLFPRSQTQQSCGNIFMEEAIFGLSQEKGSKAKNGLSQKY
jgi:hypothetical protein